MTDLDETSAAPLPDRRPGDPPGAGLSGPLAAAATPRPLWKRIASSAVIVAVIGLCGTLGFLLGQTGRGDASVATVRVESPASPARADFGNTLAPADVRSLAEWVVANGDHGQRAFAIVDKSSAKVFVFAGEGRLMGAAPVLLGLAVGDESVPGIGEKPVEKVLPHERTTPAGRFVAAPGRNHTGEEVVWIDYGAAVSMHSVRALVAEERRLERLASANPAEHRISYGCINLPHEFFKTVAQPAFSRSGGIVYVLPETRPWQTIVASTSR